MVKLNNTLLKSEFFTLSEFITSETARKHKINNVPSSDIIKNIQYGCDMVLDPLRRQLGKAVQITSGYRCPLLNKIVGGVANSWHVKGNAADIHIENDIDAKNKFDILKKIPSVDTCLFEHSSVSKWIHVQWDKTKTPRHQYNFNYNAL